MEPGAGDAELRGHRERRRLARCDVDGLRRRHRRARDLAERGAVLVQGLEAGVRGGQHDVRRVGVEPAHDRVGVGGQVPARVGQVQARARVARGEPAAVLAARGGGDAQALAAERAHHAEASSGVDVEDERVETTGCASSGRGRRSGWISLWLVHVYRRWVRSASAASQYAAPVRRACARSLPEQHFKDRTAPRSTLASCASRVATLADDRGDTTCRSSGRRVVVRVEPVAKADQFNVQRSAALVLWLRHRTERSNLVAASPRARVTDRHGGFQRTAQVVVHVLALEVLRCSQRLLHVGLGEHEPVDPFRSRLRSLSCTPRP